MQIITKPSNYFAIHTQAEINAAHNECKKKFAKAFTML